MPKRSRPAEQTKKEPKVECIPFNVRRHGTFLALRGMPCDDPNHRDENCPSTNICMTVCGDLRRVVVDRPKDYAPFDPDAFPRDLLPLVLGYVCGDIELFLDGSLSATVGLVCKEWHVLVNELIVKMHVGEMCNSFLPIEKNHLRFQFKEELVVTPFILKTMVKTVLQNCFVFTPDSIGRIFLKCASCLSSMDFAQIASLAFLDLTPEFGRVVEDRISKWSDPLRSRMHGKSTENFSIACANLFSLRQFRVAFTYTDDYKLNKIVQHEREKVPKLVQLVLQYDDWARGNKFPRQLLKCCLKNGNDAGINLFYADPRFDFSCGRKTVFDSISHAPNYQFPTGFVAENWETFTGLVQEDIVSRCSVNTTKDLIESGTFWPTPDFFMAAVSGNSKMRLIFENLTTEEKRAIHPQFERFFD